MFKFLKASFSKLLCAAFSATLWFAGESSLAVGFTGWDFEDETLQGWTLASSSTIGPTSYGAVGRTFAESATTFVAAWDPLGYNSKNPKYGFAAAPTPFADRAAAQDAPVVLRSPTFELHAGGQIIVHALGGTPGILAVPPSNFSVLSGPSINRLGDNASYQGMALRRDTDGEYLIHKVRTATGSGAHSWQQLTFTELELDAVRAANPGVLFTLDLIDTAHAIDGGAFGNLNIDTISIPVPVETSLIQGGGLWTIRERVAATGTVLSLAAADALLALPEGDPGILAGADNVYTASVVNIHDGFSQGGHFGNEQFFAVGGNHFAMSMTGNINVLQSGEITFGYYGSAGGRLMIDGELVFQDNFGDLANDNLGSIHLSAGVHAVDFVFYEDTGFETVELYVATELGQFTSINESTFELLLATDLPLPEGVPGDYNDDQVVDAADYVVWRDSLGGTSLENEGDGISPGTVDDDDYGFWVSQFGSGSGSGSTLNASVPEPSSLGMIVVLLSLGLIRWHTRSKDEVVVF